MSISFLIQAKKTMQFARKRIEELDAIKNEINENRERFDDIDSVKKAFIMGYGWNNFNVIGNDVWNDNVVGGYVERTHETIYWREYVTLVIVTKSSFTIQVDHMTTPAWNEEDLYRITITHPQFIENDFEKLLDLIMSTRPRNMYPFERINLEQCDDIKDECENIQPLV